MAWKRNSGRTRGELLRDELNETFDHALRAAGHAASGIEGTVRPRVAATRGSMVPAAGGAVRRWGSARSRMTPLTEGAQARLQSRFKEMAAMRQRGGESRRRGRDDSGREDGTGRRWPRVMGMLVAGATVGAIGAMMLRRQRQRAWEEASQPGPEAGGERTPGTGQPAGSAGPAGPSRASTTSGAASPERRPPEAQVEQSRQSPQPAGP